MMEMIKVMNLKKNYDDFEAVRGIDFNVNEGEVFGLLGPNGAGKTTTVEILEGLIEPSSGTATIANLDVVKDSKKSNIFICFLTNNSYILFIAYFMLFTMV